MVSTAAAALRAFPEPSHLQNGHVWKFHSNTLVLIKEFMPQVSLKAQTGDECGEGGEDLNVESRAGGVPLGWMISSISLDQCYFRRAL